MSTARVARHRILNHNKSANQSRTRNGFKTPPSGRKYAYNNNKNNNHINDNNTVSQPHHQNNNNFNNNNHQNGYNNHIPNKHEHHHYRTSSEEDADTDTLDDMESQSPKSRKYASPQIEKLSNYPRTANNQAVRHRLRKPIKSLKHSSPYNSPNINNDFNQPRNRNTHRYYQRHWNKKKHPLQHKKKSNKSNKNKNKNKIIVGLIIFFFTFLIYYFYGDLLTFKSLRDHHHVIIAFIDKYPIISPFIYTISVSIVVGLTIPGATVLSMAAGLFFTQPFASIYAWIGCGTGALFCYLFVRYICEDCFKSMITKHGDWFKGFENGLKKNELLYLIYVRYMIIIPFWFVNVAAALLGAKWKNFAISTLIATIPGSLLYTTAGRGLANAFEVYTEEITTWNLLKQVFWSKDIQYCLLLLLLCLLIPFLLQKYGKNYFSLLSDGKHTKRSDKYRNNDFIDSSDSDDYKGNKDKYL